MNTNPNVGTPGHIDHGKTLHLHLNYAYFDAIKAGVKKEEYRDAKIWEEKLCNNNYTKIRLYRGYQKVGPDTVLDLPYHGFIFKTIKHPHFGDRHTAVCAIDVTGEPIR